MTRCQLRRSLYHSNGCTFFPVQMMTLIICVLSICDTTIGAPSDWWNEHWHARVKLSFDQAHLPVPLTDFQLLVQLNRSRVTYDRTQDVGEDLRFIDSDNRTLLPHEIEVWDPRGNSVIWVQIPELNPASRKNYIWMYFDNDQVVDRQDPYAVWGDAYLGVWHLGDHLSTFRSLIPGRVLRSVSLRMPQDWMWLLPSSRIEGSSLGSIPGYIRGGLTQAHIVPGKIGKAIDFRNTDSSIQIGKPVDYRFNSSDPFTISAWISTTSTSFETIIASQACREGVYRGIHVFIDDDNRELAVAVIHNHYDHNKLEVLGKTSLNDGNWHYIVVTYDGSSQAKGINLYVDGKRDFGWNKFDRLSGAIINQEPWIMANRACGATPFTGRLDEVRLTKTEWSSVRVKANYANMNDLFISFGSVEDRYN